MKFVVRAVWISASLSPNSPQWADSCPSWSDQWGAEVAQEAEVPKAPCDRLFRSQNRTPRQLVPDKPAIT